jgi:hypothetical protein
VAFATERSLASTDAALPSPLDKSVVPFALLPLASSALCPFGLFFAFIFYLECGGLAAALRLMDRYKFISRSRG